MNLRDTCQAIIDGYAADKSGLDDDMVPHLIDLGDAAEDILHLLDLLGESDQYLREIRAENLDGSEPALGDLLESNYKALRGLK